MDIEEKIIEIENNLKPYETEYLHINCSKFDENTVSISFNFTEKFESSNKILRGLLDTIKNKHGYDIKANINNDSDCIITSDYYSGLSSKLYMCTCKVD